MSVGYVSEANKLCLTYFQCALEGDGVVANNKCITESEWVAQNDANLFLYYVTPARAGGIAKRGTANPCLPNGAYANVVYDPVTYECTCKHSSLSLHPALTIDEDGKYSESCSLEEPGFYRLETKRGMYLVTLFACVWNSYYQGAGQRMCVSACSEGQSVKWWTELDMSIGICKCDGGNTHFYDTKRNTCTTTAECTSNGGFVLSLDGKQCVTAHECGQIDDGYLGLNYYAYKDLGECIPEGPMMSLLGEELGISDYPEETAEGSEIYACATGLYLVVSDEHSATYCTPACAGTNSTYLYAPARACFTNARCALKGKLLFGSDQCVDECPDDSPAYSIMNMTCTTCAQLQDVFPGM